MRRATVMRLAFVESSNIDAAPDVPVAVAELCVPWFCCAVLVELIGPLLLVASDADADAADVSASSSDDPETVVNAETGTVVEPCCTTNPSEPILTTSPPDKVTGKPPRETTVPSIVATLEASAAWYAVTGVPLTVKTTADAGVAIAAADVPSTTMVPPDARLTREPSAKVWTAPPAVIVTAPITA